jgi:hypothetical protein
MHGGDASVGTSKSGGKCLAPWQNVYTAQWTGLKGPSRDAVSVAELAERGDFTVSSYDLRTGQVKAKTPRARKSGVKDLVRIVTDRDSFDLSSDHPVYLDLPKQVVIWSQDRPGIGKPLSVLEVHGWS